MALIIHTRRITCNCSLNPGNYVPETDAGGVIKKEDWIDAHKKENCLNGKIKLFLQCALSRVQLDKVDGLKVYKMSEVIKE